MNIHYASESIQSCAVMRCQCIETWKQTTGSFCMFTDTHIQTISGASCLVDNRCRLEESS